MNHPADQLSGNAYADWKAPSGDSDLLIWPDPDQLLRETVATGRRLASIDAVQLLGVSLAELRQQARMWIGHVDADQPIIATGHQTELYHAGVWVKNAVIDSAAKKLGGAAYHFAVDTDSPKHLALRWPDENVPITDDPRMATAAWTGLLEAPSPRHLSEVSSKLSAAAGGFGFTPAVGEVVDSLRRLALEQPQLSPALCNALHALDWSLGLRHHAMVCSPVWISPPFLSFVAYVLANARSFATDYNRSLGDYRDANGITSSTRPMPDLFIGDEAIELPFWLDDLSAQSRTRPTVFDLGGKTLLKLVNGDEFAVDVRENASAAAVRLGRFLAGTSHRLSPRALTLTLFLRLFVADQWVHGIGGGRYDQVLDTLIRRHFGIAPPRFAVATATMLLPTALGRERACVPCVLSEGHRLRHALLGPRKGEFVDKIAQLPRRSSDRSAVFLEMHNELRKQQASSPTLAAWQQRLEATRAAEHRDAVEFDRELFYAMQPRERLEEMIQRVNARFSGENRS